MLDKIRTNTSEIENYIDTVNSLFGFAKGDVWLVEGSYHIRSTIPRKKKKSKKCKAHL